MVLCSKAPGAYLRVHSVRNGHDLNAFSKPVIARLERRMKGYLGKAAAVSAFALLVLNVAILVSVQSRQKEMERMMKIPFGEESRFPNKHY